MSSPCDMMLAASPGTKFSRQAQALASSIRQELKQLPTYGAVLPNESSFVKRPSVGTWLIPLPAAQPSNCEEAFAPVSFAQQLEFAVSADDGVMTAGRLQQLEAEADAEAQRKRWEIEAVRAKEAEAQRRAQAKAEHEALKLRMEEEVQRSAEMVEKVTAWADAIRAEKVEPPILAKGKSDRFVVESELDRSTTEASSRTGSPPEEIAGQVVSIAEGLAATLRTEDEGSLVRKILARSRSPPPRRDVEPSPAYSCELTSAPHRESEQVHQAAVKAVSSRGTVSAKQPDVPVQSSEAFSISQIGNLQQRFLLASPDEILNALRKHDGHAGRAANELAKRLSKRPSAAAAKEGRPAREGVSEFGATVINTDIFDGPQDLLNTGMIADTPRSDLAGDLSARLSAVQAADPSTPGASLSLPADALSEPFSVRIGRAPTTPCAPPPTPMSVGETLSGISTRAQSWDTLPSNSVASSLAVPFAGFGHEDEVAETESVSGSGALTIDTSCSGLEATHADAIMKGEGSTDHFLACETPMSLCSVSVISGRAESCDTILPQLVRADTATSVATTVLPDHEHFHEMGKRTSSPVHATSTAAWSILREMETAVNEAIGVEVDAQVVPEVLIDSPMKDMGTARHECDEVCSHANHDDWAGCSTPAPAPQEDCGSLPAMPVRRVRPSRSSCFHGCLAGLVAWRASA